MFKNITQLSLGLVLLSVSCTRQEPISQTEAVITPINVITANVIQTRTMTDDGVNILWNDGDKIGLFVANSSTAEDRKRSAVFQTSLQEPSAEAVFNKINDLEAGLANGRYYAAYPYEAISRWGSQNAMDNQPAARRCYVMIPANQTAAKGCWDHKAGILAASSTTSTFSFKHAVAYLRFEVTDQTGEFMSVRLSSADNTKLSDPQASVHLSASGQVSVAPSASASDYVILKSSVSDSAFVQSAYYIAIMPGDYSSGLTLSFVNEKGLVAERSSGALTLNPGEVSDWGPIAALTFTEQKAPLEIATVYKEKDANIGVVYWIDPDNPYKGKIVSPSSASPMDWSDGLIWTDKIQSQEDGLLNYQQFNESEVYTSQKERYYALKYCEDMRSRLGGNWYLPASAELRTLYQTYYGLSEKPSSNGTDYRFENGALLPGAMAAKADFDSALSQLGETVTATLDGDADADGVCDNAGFGDANGVTYWSSKVNTGGAIQYVNVGVYDLNNTGKVAKKAYVRCVRDVDLNASVEGGDNEGGNDDGEGNEDEGGNEGGSEDAPVVDEVGSGIDPLNPFDVFNIPRRVSLVGDSITTFEGTLVTTFPNSENGGAYYPTGNVTSVSNQYWHKLIYGKMSNAVLEVNNSLRGSTVIWRDNTAYDGADYCARVERHGLGNPDVVLIHGGTNDCTKHSADYAPRPGMYRADMYPGDAYSGMAPSAIPAADEFKAVFDAAEAADTWEKIIALEDGYFIHAYVKLLNMIHFKHPNAKVVIIIGDALTKRAMQALVTIADHYKSLYGYSYVDFFGQADQISKAAGAHPDDAGFTYMADKIYDEVGSYIDPK